MLFPVRFLFTAQTGEVGTNSVAAERYLANARGPAAKLVSAASRWRLDPPAGDEAAALLDRELIPLYVHYIDDHIARLREISNDPGSPTVSADAVPVSWPDHQGRVLG